MLFNAWYIVFPTILFSYKLKVCWWKMVLWNFASRNFCTFSFYNQLLFFRALIWLTGIFITAISDMLRQRLCDIKTEIRCEVFCIYLTIAMSVYCWCSEPDNTFKTCLVVSYSAIHAIHVAFICFEAWATAGPGDIWYCLWPGIFYQKHQHGHTYQDNMLIIREYLSWYSISFH